MNAASLKGRLLIASPRLDAPPFARAVILVLEHDEERGAAGVILNLATGATMTDLAGKLFDPDFVWDKPLHLGGPVAGPLMVLHAGPRSEDPEVIAGLYVTLDATRAQHLISQEIEPSLVIANFAGWAPGQLEREIAEDAWIVAPVNPRRIFDEADGDLWWSSLREVRAAALRAVVGIRHLPADPRLN